MTSDTATTPDPAEALASSPLRHVQVASGGVGARVRIDGLEVSAAVRSVVVQAAIGEITTAVVELFAGADTGSPEVALFDGLARVVVGEPPEMGPDVARFLGEIDAGELERAALNRPEVNDGTHGLTKAMLAQLVEWANGRS